MSRNYLQEFGRSWYFDAPLILRHVQNYANSMPEFAGVRDIVILSERLAHPVNTYAGPFMEEILRSINGKPVRSVEDIPAIIQAETSEFLIFEFYKQKTPLVLERTAAIAADTSINEQYQVSQPQWFGDSTDDGATSDWERNAP